MAEHKANKKQTGKKPAGKNPTGKKSAERTPLGKKPAGKNQLGKSQTGKKQAGKKQEGGKHPDQKRPDQKRADGGRMSARSAGGHSGGAKSQAHGSRAGSSAGLCPVERECGACQHISEPYDAQLARKNALVARLFSPFEGASVLPILGMDDPFHYRNKVVSPFVPGRKLASPTSGKERSASGKGGSPRAGKAPRHEILCGMYAAHSHRVVSTDSCLIENEQGKKVIRAIRDIMLRFGMEPYREDTGTGFVRHAIVRIGHASGEVLVTVVTNGSEFTSSRSFCRELVKRCPFVTTVVQNVNERQTNVILGEQERTIYGPGFILDTLCGLSFRISSQSFYQVNAVQTEVLYRTAMDFAQLEEGARVVDAYCGTGTIGLVAAASGAGEVIGVDSVDAAIRDARENARHNGIENARFVTEDATAFMKDLAACGETIDVVLMDPPRAGSTDEFIDAVGALAPARVAYVSCNPETQVRDLERFGRHGYRVEKVQPVDMFPHTEHVETVVLLVQEGA